MNEDQPLTATGILARERMREQVARESFIGPIEQRIKVRSMGPVSEEQILAICEEYKAPRSRVDVYVRDGLFYRLVQE
ncbi:MAG: hypothetical protein KF826_08410 [Xanthobacteraceae bacterium]|nr:hypothetical protein [Xanthobacteraceae bacterium]MCW5676047.1 hypothetical protein [Xanthobacteraceae bacterium]MCW5677512.1 hypothetical protein [Xanthobacteraceae bacterium]